MRCPKCESAFEALRFEHVEVDRCTGCGGIWFDALEREHLAQFTDARGIDSGDRKLGRRYNELRDVRCPRCDVLLLRMTDEAQFHIEYDYGPTCLGTFFDAGEFKDLTEVTIAERIRKIVDLWLSVR